MVFSAVTSHPWAQPASSHSRGVWGSCSAFCPVTAGPSVPLQGLDEQVVQAAHHGAGVIQEPCCDHGVLVDLLNEQLGQVRLAVSQLTELLDQRVPATQKPPEGGLVLCSSTRARVTHWVMCPGDSDRCTQQPSAPKLRCRGGWYLWRLKTGNLDRQPGNKLIPLAPQVTLKLNVKTFRRKLKKCFI